MRTPEERGNSTNQSTEENDAAEQLLSSIDISPIGRHQDLHARSRLETRDTFPKCSLLGLMNARAAAGASESPKAKRYIVRGYNELNDTSSEELWGLLRRTMSLPRPRERNMWLYYEPQLVANDFKPIVFYNGEDARYSSFNSAIFEDIGGPAAKSIGVDLLCGCTTLVIASRTGVYGAHYFENIAFAIDEEWNDPSTGGYVDQEDAFVKTVIQGLQRGVGGIGVPPLYPGKPEQRSLTSVAPQINAGAGPNPADPKIKGYLFFPSASHDENATPYAEYQAKFQRIKTAVGQIIPALQFNPAGPNPLWTDIPYNRLNADDERLGRTWNGVLLFKYDPDHEGKKKAALWAENNPIDLHNDQWT